MFVGMDVTHPTPNSQNGAPSIAAVVATEEPNHFVNWPVSLRLQRPKEDKMARELIDDMQAMFRERLEHWKSKNDNRLPGQIIIYRDGVSDEFYKLLKESEIPRMKQAAAEAALPSQGYNPYIVYIVVLKRHSTRFFPSPEKNVTDRTHLDKNGDPKPGLLVVDKLTRRPGSNFFLQSHESLKGTVLIFTMDVELTLWLYLGTARPTHYLIKINRSCHDDLAVMKMVCPFNTKCCHVPLVVGSSKCATAVLADLLYRRMTSAIFSAEPHAQSTFIQQFSMPIWLVIEPVIIFAKFTTQVRLVRITTRPTGCRIVFTSPTLPYRTACSTYEMISTS